MSFDALTKAGAPPEALEALRAGVRSAADKVVEQVKVGLVKILDTGGAGAAKLIPLLEKAKSLKVQELTTADPKLAAQYADAYSTCVMRIKTVALAEGVVKSDQTAAMVQTFLATALDAVGTVAVQVLGALVRQAVKGAVEGLAGESGGGFRG